jgi:hypothetical protein
MNLIVYTVLTNLPHGVFLRQSHFFILVKAPWFS